MLVTPDAPFVPFLALLMLLAPRWAPRLAPAAWAAFATTLVVIATTNVAAQGGDSADVTLIAALLSVPFASGSPVGAWRAQSARLAVLAVRLEHERDARARLAASEERARLARELHDSVAHALTVIALQADGAASVLARQPERAGAAAHTIAAVAGDALEEVRELLGLLDLGRRPSGDGGARHRRRRRRPRRPGPRERARGRPAGRGTRAPLPALDATAYRSGAGGPDQRESNTPRAPGRCVTSPLRGTVASRWSVVDDGAARAPAAPPSGYGLVGMRNA